MGDQSGEIPEIEQVGPEVPAEAGRRRWLLVLGAVLLLMAIGIAGLWTQRERLADRIIASQLEKLKLEGTYQVERIGPRRQVLTNIVIGNPARPDFTAERAEILIEPRFGIPTIEAVTLTRARIYGAYRGGKLSFGALDPILFEQKDSKEPFRLPDLDLRLIDGRGRMETDYGVVGLKLDGAGNLRGGFAGTLAAIAPRVVTGGCTITDASVFGRLSVAGEQPRFAGPVRMARLGCPAQALTAGRTDADIELTVDKPFDGFRAEGRFAAAVLAYAGNRVGRAEGKTGLTFRGGDLTAEFDLTGRAARLAGVALGELGVTGALRSRDGFARIESEGEVTGREVRLGGELDSALADAAAAGKDTLAAPLLTQLRTALAREAPGSSLSALYSLRQTGGITNLLVPRGGLRGGSGAPLLTVSRFELVSTPGAAPRFAGNLITGGAGLPEISGQFARRGGGGIQGRLRMADYRAGDSRLALPELVVVQNRDGSLGFAGKAFLTGKLPGGSARNLALPLDGTWSPRSGLAAWRGCIDLRYDELGYANLILTNKRLLVCPGPGGAILRYAGEGVMLAAGAPALNVSGRLGTTPIRVASGPVGFAMPGSLAARSLTVSLGPVSSPTTFRISNLSARVGDDIAGRFADTDARIGTVPLEILGASGSWRYAKGVLTLSDGAFRLEDREADDRFRPLIAREATLRLADNRITATALLREPASDRAVTGVDIIHNLSNGTGHADLAVDNLVFDRQLQPDTLTRLALGVIANASGRIDGTGRIDWNPAGVTSTGRFTTDRLDFAAAFGPVKGAIVFTDLLGLVTAPGQRLAVQSINPGIEVNDGVLVYQLEPDNVLQVLGMTWPFMDGTLTLKPTRMVLGAAEERRFELEVEGLNSAKFIERLQFGNINSTGIFDGVLPLVFDENGGRIVGGRLVSRPPGGNVSYVGELTYRDLSAIGNYAFETLRSLDYREMVILMNGDLDGEIATSVKFDGVRQGATAKRNFITKRFEKLPIQFNVNIKAPFFQLVTSLRSLYDPTYLKDPRELGLIDAQGNTLNGGIIGPDTPVPGPGPKPDIQPPASRNRP